MKPSLENVIDRLSDMESHFLFTYKGMRCGIDPISRNSYHIWFGLDCATVKSVNEVIESRMWDGRTLADIFDDIEIDAY